MRSVLYITPSVELLGARISLVEFLTHLNRSAFRPVVISPSEGPLTEKLRSIGVATRVVRFGNWRKVKNWPFIPRAVHKIINIGREESASLWHCNEFWAFPYAYWSAKKLKIPTICHFRCSRKPRQLPPRKLKNYYVHKADQIIAVSKYQKTLFNQIREVDSKFTVIPNGVDIDRFSAANRMIFRDEVGINCNDFLVGMVGPVCEHKGVEEFLRAASLVIPEFDNLKFVVVGPEKSKAFLSRMSNLADSLNLNSHLSFTGFRSDISNIMAGLDLLVTPSRVEAFGRVLIEAMAAKTPVVASNVGGIPEIVSSSDYGVLVQPRNISEFAETITKLLKNKEERQTISEKALQHVKLHYTIQHHTRQIEQVYEKLLNS